MEVEGFPFRSLALGRLLYLQEGTSRGGAGLDPGVGAAEAVRTSPFSKRWWGQSPQLSYPARKDLSLETSHHQV